MSALPCKRACMRKFRGKLILVYIQSDTYNNACAFYAGFGEDAAHFFAVDINIVGPVQGSVKRRILLDGFGNGKGGKKIKKGVLPYRERRAKQDGKQKIISRTRFPRAVEPSPSRRLDIRTDDQSFRRPVLGARTCNDICRIERWLPLNGLSYAAGR